MKLFLTAGVLAWAMLCESKASLIAQWTFETSRPTTGASFVAENGINSGISLASRFHASALNYTSPTGAGSANSFSSAAWSVGDYYQFTTSTLGYNNIDVSFKATSSDTGPKNFKLAYSTDGATFYNFSSYSVLAQATAPNPAWSTSMTSANAALYSYSVSLTARPALNDQSTVYFRLIDNSTTSASGGTVASSGTSRVDDYTISATPIPELSTFIAGALLGLPLGLSWFRRRRNRHHPEDLFSQQFCAALLPFKLRHLAESRQTNRHQLNAETRRTQRGAENSWVWREH